MMGFVARMQERRHRTAYEREYKQLLDYAQQDMNNPGQYYYYPAVRDAAKRAGRFAEAEKDDARVRVASRVLNLILQRRYDQLLSVINGPGAGSAEHVAEEISVLREARLLSAEIGRPQSVTDQLLRREKDAEAQLRNEQIRREREAGAQRLIDEQIRREGEAATRQPGQNPRSEGSPSFAARSYWHISAGPSVETMLQMLADYRRDLARISWGKSAFESALDEKERKEAEAAKNRHILNPQAEAERVRMMHAQWDADRRHAQEARRAAIDSIRSGQRHVESMLSDIRAREAARIAEWHEWHNSFRYEDQQRKSLDRMRQQGGEGQI